MSRWIRLSRSKQEMALFLMLVPIPSTSKVAGSTRYDCGGSIFETVKSIFTRCELAIGCGKRMTQLSTGGCDKLSRVTVTQFESRLIWKYQARKVCRSACA